MVQKTEMVRKTKLLKKEFILDEDTVNRIINNSINICNKKECGKICNNCEKEIIKFFADSCIEFEEIILYNKSKGIKINKTSYGGLQLFFDPDEITHNYNVISAWNFVNLALTNIFFNNKFCNNMYFRLSSVLTKGAKFKMLDDNKNYIKIYLDMTPQSNNFSFKKDIKKFIYLKRG